MTKISEIYRQKLNLNIRYKALDEISERVNSDAEERLLGWYKCKLDEEESELRSRIFTQIGLHRDELDSCPFCDNSVDWCGSEDDSDCCGCHLIHCPSCGVFDMHPEQSDLGLTKLRKVCADKWNKRDYSEVIQS